MRIHKIVLGIGCCALMALQSMAATATFDWEETIDQAWWQNYGQSETNNGVILTAGGRAGASNVGGTNGFAAMSTYAQDTNSGTFAISDGGVSTFVVTSIDIQATGGTPDEITPMVEGKSGGSVVWTIIPTKGVGMVTYTTASSGDLTGTIDQIVWNTGQHSNPNATFGNNIDNLIVETTEPPVFEEGEALFDWEEFTGNWWDPASFSYSETENGITMSHSGRTSGSTGGAGGNGVAVKAAYAQDLDPGFITMQQGGEDVWFIVQSIDIEANGGVPVEIYPTVQGEADGVIMWTITPATNAGLVTYTAATEGDLSEAVERIIWNTGQHSDPNNTFNNTIDNLSIKTSLPATEIIYDWNWGSFWTPHATFYWNMPAHEMDCVGAVVNSDQYWWNGGSTTGTPAVIKHRPGLANLPASGGFHTQPYDINVGGLPNRGLTVTNQVRTLVSNEVLRVTYDWKMFVNGSDDGRFMDMFFSTTSGQSQRQFGTTGSELGFAWYQTMNSNDVAITFAADDQWMSITPPVLRIPLTGLGITAGSDNDGDDLAITYTAKKSSVADTWLCSILVSNKATTATYSAENVAIVNSTAYNNPTYFCIYTADDLSDGDSASGANPAGYEMDALRVAIMLNPPPAPEGYAAYLDAYGMEGQANSGEYEDFDFDGMLNIYEYAWGGDPTNSAVQGVLPEMSVSGGVSYYTILELKDPLSGITYEVLTTDNLVIGTWSEPTWDSEVPTSYNDLYNSVQRGLNTTGAQFFKTVISTNAP